MPLVENRVVIEGSDLETVWRVMCDFEAFPSLMADVVAVSCSQRRGQTFRSDWTVLLNGSELTWTEHDELVPLQEIRFHQIDGDLEVWEGRWTLRQEGRAIVVDLTVRFDIGIPTLAHILDPIGERAIAANARQMLDAIHRNSREDVP